MDPPGTWLQNAAIFDMLGRRRAGKRFVEIGCGDGSLSRRLLERGFSGAGVDVSPQAIAEAEENLAPALAQGSYALHHGDIRELRGDATFDVALSIMVVEHIEEPVPFVRAIADVVAPGGLVVVGAPGRMDRWSIEDDTVGHLRRYEKEELAQLLRDAGLQDVEVWSVAVPVANVLLRIGNGLIRRSASEMQKRELAKPEQTLTSGIRDIPFKTTFPAPFRLILNRWTMLPLALFQRLFYRSRLGITFLASGRVRR
jgi:2-polyprenyl-3-methyl-5-hydroxy-6-metoxy-1,4-benzoquinol methylase